MDRLNRLFAASTATCNTLAVILRTTKQRDNESKKRNLPRGRDN
jgi:hypothetical protein